MDKKNVVVLGAGVIGLTVATFLLKQEKGIKVHIIANIFPNDPEASTYKYTSTVAGAHWRSHSDTDPRQQGFEESTYNYFWELANRNMSNVTGVMVIDEFNYWEKSDNFVDPWYSRVCHEYRRLEKNELPDGVELGIKYKSLSINPLTYLNYLLSTFIFLGGTTEHAEINHLDECVREDTDILINCSGYNARTLKGVEDSKVYPVRGQSIVMQLSQSCLNWACFRHGYYGDTGVETYIIPRENGEVIIGGTREENNSSTEIEHDTASKIIQRCFATRPDLLPEDTKIELKLKGHRVGLRPYRKGGIRVEAEWKECENFNNKKVLVCHNYGHGGV
ncbi:4634_t:CDS:10, partial [Dentiscutata erythropus]